MVAFDKDVLSSSEPTPSSFLPVRRDVSDVIASDARLSVSGGVINGQTVMGILMAIAGLVAIAFAIFLLYHKRGVIRESGEALLERASQATLHRVRVHRNQRQSWNYAVPRHGEQLPPYSPPRPSNDQSHRRGAQARAVATPGPPPPAYFPGDNAYLSFNGGPP